MTSRRRNLTALAFVALLAAAALGQQGDGRNVRRLLVPGRTWAVELALPNFNVRQDALSADGRARKLRADIESEGCVVTVTIVTASTTRVSSKDLRDLAAERFRAGTTVRRENLKTSDYKQTPTLEHLVRDFKGEPLDQKLPNAYVSRDNVWIDNHFSKAP